MAPLSPLTPWRKWAWGERAAQGEKEQGWIPRLESCLCLWMGIRSPVVRTIVRRLSLLSSWREPFLPPQGSWGSEEAPQGDRVSWVSALILELHSNSKSWLLLRLHHCGKCFLLFHLILSRIGLGLNWGTERINSCYVHTRDRMVEPSIRPVWSTALIS